MAADLVKPELVRPDLPKPVLPTPDPLTPDLPKPDPAKPDPPSTAPPRKRAFRPDIEGLRAVAVLIVLGFHAAVPGMSGGYVGVDVFFVVSGFLITGQIVDGIRKNQTFSLPEFYARRARRILPAACVVLLATTLASWLILPPLRQKDVAYDILTAALNGGNWRFVADQTDYLAASRTPSPLLHYWSLGVEEQFYLVWAPIVLLIGLLARRLGRSPRWFIFSAVLLLTAASLALSIQWTRTSAPLAYMGSPSRAWQFGAGAALAVVLATGRGVPDGRLARILRIARIAAGFVGMAAILGSTVLLDSHTRYPGTAALVPTVGAVLVLSAGAGKSHTKAEIPGLLAREPLRVIGRLSFCLYLWHWPILVLAQAWFGNVTWPGAVLLVMLSVLPAAATLRLVEQPLRFSALVASTPKRGLAIGVTAILLPLGAGLAVGSGAVRTLGAAKPFDVALLPAGAPSGANLFATAVGHRSGGATMPSPVQAREDFPPDGACEAAPASVTSPACLWDANGVPSVAAPTADRVVLLGDSHAGQWFSAVRKVAEQHHLATEELVKQGCPLPALTVTSPVLGREYHECDAWRAATLDRLAHEPAPRLIVVSTLNWYTSDDRALLTAWDATLAKLQAIGAPIAYLRDNPKPDQDIPVCVSGAQRRWSDCSFPRARALAADPVGDEIAAGKRPGMSLVDVGPILCPAQKCPAVLDGVLLYRDDSHLTNAAAYLLAPRLDAQFPLQGAGWRTVWRDDFTGPAGTSPSAADWLFDIGHCYPGCPAPNWGTGEIETMSASPANVGLDGRGNLAITPLRAADGTWTSGRIETKRADFGPPPGGVLRLATRIQQPDVDSATGAGYWPAFWALGSGVRDGSRPWPGGGEVDVFEGLNGRGSLWGTLHCGSLPTGPCGEPKGFGSGEQPCAGCQSGFHTYAVEIDRSQQPEQVRWYLDGAEYFHVSSDQVDAATWDQAVHHGFFAVFDVAIGGSFPASVGGGTPGPGTASGRPMVIDYVEVSTRGR